MRFFGPNRAVVLAAACLLGTGCGERAADAPHCRGVPQHEATLAPPGLDLAAPGVSRPNLRAWIETLTDPALAGRHATGAGARSVAVLLAGHFASLGLAAPHGDGFCQSFPVVDSDGHNVIAHLADPAGGAPRPTVLLGAHYDGQGTHPLGAAYPGADDNASGVAALLEVARLARDRRGAGVDWVFVAFGAEEVGLLGSRRYLEEPSVSLERLVLAVNLDMVGRPLPRGTPEALGTLVRGPRREWTSAALARAAVEAGVEVVSLEDFGGLRPTISDADTLGSRLPTLFVSTALHADYHRRSDTAGRLDLGQVERTARLVLALAASLREPLPASRTAPRRSPN